MTKAEALDLFSISGDCDREYLRMIYHAAYVGNFRSRSSAVNSDEAAALTGKLHKLNQAYTLLCYKERAVIDALMFDFNPGELISLPQNRMPDREAGFREVVGEVLAEGKHGMAMSLLERGIAMSLSPSSSLSLKPLDEAVRMLGKIVCDLGLISQSITLKTAGLGNIEKANVLYSMNEFRLAAQAFATELQADKPQMEKDELCLHIAACHFMLAEYEYALDVVESVLPRIMPAKAIFRGRHASADMAMSLMLCMKKIRKRKGIFLEKAYSGWKYPITVRYLMKCHGSLERAFKIRNKFMAETEESESIPPSLKTKFSPLTECRMEYDMEEYSRYYYRLFSRPLSGSLIYNPE